MKRDGRYNTPAFIAARLLELALGESSEPADVLLSLPNEWEA